MRFGRWQPLDEAAHGAPAAPGVFQIRAEGLVDYPRGKSAMVRYGAAADLRAALGELAAAWQGRALLCRLAEEMSERERRDPQGAAAALIEGFSRRFGAPPSLPEELGA